MYFRAERASTRCSLRIGTNPTMTDNYKNFMLFAQDMKYTDKQRANILYLGIIDIPLNAVLRRLRVASDRTT